jgi:hypothetical protein
MTTIWNQRIKPIINFIDRAIVRIRTFLLKEDGAYLLLENGGRIILISTGDYADRTKPLDTWVNRTQI